MNRNNNVDFDLFVEENIRFISETCMLNMVRPSNFALTLELEAVLLILPLQGQSFESARLNFTVGVLEAVCPVSSHHSEP